MEPWRLTATEAAALIREEKLTVEAYAKSLLSRIEQRDPAVQAWAYLDPEAVLKRARELDAVPKDQRGPLHGIPIGVKDVIYTKDMPTQHNSKIYEDDAPKVDAGSVQILRHAGALIFGKTTTTEFAASTVGPKTRNPHDPGRTPGGSSSGSGAAVGDFQVPIALGTQTGGSVIRPGSFNGVYAMKPTWGAITREGQKIYSVSLDTLGFYARSIADLQLLASVFAVKDDEEPPAAPFAVRGAKFAMVKTMIWPQAGPGTAAAMQRAAELLREASAEVEEVELPGEFDELPKWHRCMLTCDGRAAFLPEHRTARDKLDNTLAGHVENVQKYSRADQLAACDGIAALRPKIDEFARGYAAVVTPSVPDEAPLGTGSTGSAAFNSIWTALHVPVVNVPGFKGASGMPVGVSLVAPRFRDQHLLAVCQEVGKIFEGQGGWTRPVW
ncbi:Amidase [Pleurostoma richardsiae]|uniref:Amidase n=1 Tax=Pleurostoma richardsiae TaxID=41990 RepID=A0AA38VJB5_9PEZI|nr:Amidase [Pleurostoma richardsiae]